MTTLLAILRTQPDRLVYLTSLYRLAEGIEWRFASP